MGKKKTSNLEQIEPQFHSFIFFKQQFEILFFEDYPLFREGKSPALNSPPFEKDFFPFVTLTTFVCR